MTLGVLGKKVDNSGNLKGPNEAESSGQDDDGSMKANRVLKPDGSSGEKRTEGSSSSPSAASSSDVGGSLKNEQIKEKYWRQPVGTNRCENVVVIHVCDENRQMRRDFVCKREILVHHMKYFQGFLSENEKEYEDIDISVHCDVEIFEWLMAFIHEPEDPPTLDKAIVVSILISSEFLQMDALVDQCLEFVNHSLNDIIKLPIDLSCISEKLINKLAFMTQPKTLALTRDRKDKILNKLYKRRVELDFSRKAGSRGGTRSIAASLTCCMHCGFG